MSGPPDAPGILHQPQNHPPRSRMTLRTLAQDIRDYPATACFSLIWILIFAAMVAVRMQEQPAPGVWRFLVLGIGDGHRFGDLTLRDLRHGEVWRLITCTFIHYSLIHIALNVLAFFLLGTLVESWYGTSQLILIYGLTGGLGNLVSAGIRYAIGSGENVHSGGGSVVIMGLIGLCAVMGLRSQTAMGSDLGLADAQGPGDDRAARYRFPALH